MSRAPLLGPGDAQLREQVGEAKLGHGLVDDEAHRALVAVRAQIDDRALEARVAHGGHGDQQLAGEGVGHAPKCGVRGQADQGCRRGGSGAGRAGSRENDFSRGAGWRMTAAMRPDPLAALLLCLLAAPALAEAPSLPPRGARRSPRWRRCPAGGRGKGGTWRPCASPSRRAGRPIGGARAPRASRRSSTWARPRVSRARRRAGRCPRCSSSGGCARSAITTR
jgi:hypothetical protein